MKPPKTILIGLDLLKSDKDLIAQAMLQAKAFHAKIWMIHVVASSGDDLVKGTSSKPVGQMNPTEMTDAQKKILSNSKAVQNQGIDCDGQVLTGQTSDTLIAEIEQIGADLLIIGEKKHGSVYKALMGGSTSSKILKAINIPVLIVPISVD